MKKVLPTLAVLGLVVVTVLAITALAGATPDRGQGDKGRADSPGKSGGKADDKADRILFARLNGRNEIGPDGRRGAGDLDGRGGFTALVEDGEVCFGLTVDNIDAPIAAHIHRGKRRENGPIVVTLIPPSSGDPGASSGCVPPDGGNTAVLQEILKHSNRFYANVHTGPFPSGAIRGQLRHRRP
jgi:CHRD domain